METFLSIAIGLGLSAACGFRIFVPLLVMSAASLTGHLHLAAGFQWIGSYPACVAFSVATVLEIVGYYVPLVDHALDVIATPVSVIAGMMVMASLVTNLDPFLKWTLAVIAGGGAAGLVQGTTVATRAASTTGTGGLTNPFVASLELGGSAATSILSIVAPLVVLLLLALFLFFAGRFLLRRSRRAKASQAQISNVSKDGLQG